jgi:DNA-binding HxlR family transcriptional regulator
MTANNQLENDGILSPAHPTCPYRNIICRFGDKWSLLVLYMLHSAAEPVRFNALQPSVVGLLARP